jgi:hypothetical protein
VIPRDSAVDAETAALDLLVAVLQYREDIRPALDAGTITAATAVEDTSELRRRVGMVTDTLIRRALSPGSVLASQQAARVAERIAGLTLRGTPAGLVPRPRDVFGSAAGTVRAMGAATDEEWAAAIEQGISGGDLSLRTLSVILDRDDLSAAEQDQRGIMSRLAGEGGTVEQMAVVLDLAPDRVRELVARYDLTVQSADSAARFDAVDTAALIGDVVALLAQAGPIAQRVDPAEVERLSQAQCADWSRELWLSAKFVLQLRARLDARATGR